MPSKYRPQIFGWFGDLDKGPYSVPLHDDRLSYANNTYCAFIRQDHNDQIFYSSLYLIATILLFIAVILWIWLLLIHKPEAGNSIVIIAILALMVSIFSLYITIPAVYQSLFSRRGSPIIFNRKTGKVYVNESYFFNFKVLRHPAV
ncbi:DUF6708 domain-containing protein, partial [Gilliamella sp. Choc4-2]|uniref:DUF6708 domain-containing protein n=1 Tax=Gilliamella sp. Choc4-2 TaxID=3120237 RepID=UPI00114743E8